MGNLQKGILFASITALCWGFLAIGLKVATNRVDPSTIVWFRFSVAFLAMLIFHLWKSPSEIKILIRPPWVLVAATIFLAWNYMGFMLGVHYMGPGNTQVVIQTGPVTLALIGIIFFRERVTVRQTVGFILAAIGMFVFYHNQTGQTPGNERLYNLGFLLTLSAAFTWALYAAMQKKLVNRYSTASLNLFLFGFPVLLYFPFINLAPLDELNWGWWLLLISLGLNTLISYGTLSLALKYMEASKVSIIIILNPIITFITMAILAYIEVSWIAAEQFSVFSIAGAIIVLTGAILVVKKKKQRVTGPETR
ncbi:MAG: DMT family transporter [Prolixibacteraceae bacterium]|nr:DMT family transporter [Prolixibacteraceae bacterium]